MASSHDLRTRLLSLVLVAIACNDERSSSPTDLNANITSSRRVLSLDRAT